jgi:ribosome-associated protein YbcJ (S4-like RNA binding protein)
MIHASFLQVIGDKSARQEESVTRLKETHVKQALKQVGFGDLGGQAKASLDDETTDASLKRQNQPNKSRGQSRQKCKPNKNVSWQLPNRT